MKKVVGIGAVLLVAVSSLLVPLWLAPAPQKVAPTAGLTASHNPVRPDSSGAAVRTERAGRVWEVYFHEGQAVHKGQLLLKLVEKLPSAAQLQLQHQLQKQQQTLTALLAQQPAATGATVVAAQGRVAATQAQLAHTPAQLGTTFVTAPADGTVTGRTAVAGDYLAAHTTIAHLQPGTPANTTPLLSSVE